MANIFAKHWRLVLIILGIILFLWVLYLLRIVVLPFATGLVLAYLLMPVIWWLEKKLPPRRKWPGFRRIMSVLITFIVLICIVGGFGYVIVSAVIDASGKLVEGVPGIIYNSILQIESWIDNLISSLPVDMQAEASAELLQGGLDLGNTIRDGIVGALSTIPDNYAIVFGFAVLPFFLFYLLKDNERLTGGIYSALSPDVREHMNNIVDIIEKVIGRYIRAQLMLGIIVWYFTFVGLLLLQIRWDYAMSLAMLAGVLEVVPTLGPWISGIIATILVLATTPDKVIWVILLYLGVQTVENNFLVPKVQSAYLGIHPAVMIVLLVFGAYIAGFWGILLIGPLTATLVEVFKYIRNYYRAQNVVSTPEAGSTA